MKTECFGCPFLLRVMNNSRCSLNYSFADSGEKDPVSYNCQLEIVQYAVKTEHSSITFLPKRTGQTDALGEKRESKGKIQAKSQAN